MNFKTRFVGTTLLEITYENYPFEFKETIDRSDAQDLLDNMVKVRDEIQQFIYKAGVDIL